MPLHVDQAVDAMAALFYFYFLGDFGVTGPIVENEGLLMFTLEAKARLQTSLLFMKSLSKTDTPPFNP